MINEENKNKKQEHEERTTVVYRIGDAIRELENDLVYQRSFPRTYTDERTDIIRISGGWGAPSLVINKKQCIGWMREHLRSKPTEADKHWAEEGKLFVKLQRNQYWVWVTCGEVTVRTEWSKNALDRAEEARHKIWREEE